MAIREVAMYRVFCDFPGCERSAQDDGEYYAWAEPGSAVDEAVNGDWRQGPDNEDYCFSHPVHDVDDIEKTPADNPVLGAWVIDLDTYEFPCLLLDHDGDARLVRDADLMVAVLNELEKAS